VVFGKISPHEWKTKLVVISTHTLRQGVKIMKKNIIRTGVLTILAAIAIIACINGINAAADDNLPIKTMNDRVQSNQPAAPGNHSFKIAAADTDIVRYSAATGESDSQEEKDNAYMTSLMERPEVSFLQFESGPFVKADEIFSSFDVACNFVRLHSPYSSYELTMEGIKESLYDIHSKAVGLDEQMEEMKKMRESLSSPEQKTIEPVCYNDEPQILASGKLDKVEVAKVIFHACLNDSPYAVVVRFDAYAGEGSAMKLYQGYMTMLKDDYTWKYYHCSGLKEIE
jgi:hypothetical protein